MSWWRHCRSKKATHQRTRQNAKMPAKLFYVSYSRRARKQCLEEDPAVIRYTSKINCKLAQSTSLTVFTSVCHESSSELSPSCRKTNVNQSANSTLPE